MQFSIEKVFQFLLLSPAFILSGCVLLLPITEQDKETVPPEQSLHYFAPSRVEVSKQPATAASRRIEKERRYLNNLIQSLSSDQAVVRVNAATSIGLLGGRASPAVPALMQRLNDQHKRVRRASAQALGKIGDRRAVPALKHVAQSDSDKWVAYSANRSLRMLGTEQARRVINTYTRSN